jgi:hypothetical protein
LLDLGQIDLIFWRCFDWTPSEFVKVWNTNYW